MQVDAGKSTEKHHSAVLIGTEKWTGMIIGHRMMTVTAWRLRRIRDRCITEAVRKFLGTELAGGGMTSLSSSGRFTTFVRYPACARMVNLEKIKGTCQCGEALPGPN
jgi:hypothetical protein